jgi:outer membrane protein assembly factor BamB
MKNVHLCALLFALGTAQAENWPGWRGPRGDGSCVEPNVPVQWSATSNIAWCAEIPGIGHGSPIIWDDRIFLLTALTQKQERCLVCLDRADGKLLWQRTVVTAPLERKHGLNSFASSTPVTDGQLVYCTFLDQTQMVAAAYDYIGKLQWLVNPGVFSSKHGFCSSPVIYKDKLIINGDHDGASYIVALDRATGKTLWKIPREHHTRSYCTPIIRDLAGKTQLILSGDMTVASYDPETGARHWIIQGPTEQMVASLVYNEKANLLFYTGGFPELHILAIKPDGVGDITKTHIAWRTMKGAGYVPSPASLGDYFFNVTDQGTFSSYRATDGAIQWSERLGSTHASLLTANGLVYTLADSGLMTIVKPGPTFDVVARNEIGEKCFASPIVNRGQLFLRSDKHLFCIGQAR